MKNVTAEAKTCFCSFCTGYIHAVRMQADCTQRPVLQTQKDWRSAHQAFGGVYLKEFTQLQPRDTCPPSQQGYLRGERQAAQGALAWRTWVAAMRISPDLGVARLALTPISSAASARASSVCTEHHDAIIVSLLHHNLTQQTQSLVVHKVDMLMIAKETKDIFRT